MQAKKAGYERELTELRIRHNEILADETLDAEKREALQKEHQQAERELTVRYTQDLISAMQSILRDSSFEGIDLSGKYSLPKKRKN